LVSTVAPVSPNPTAKRQIYILPAVGVRWCPDLDNRQCQWLYVNRAIDIEIALANVYIARQTVETHFLCFAKAIEACWHKNQTLSQKLQQWSGLCITWSDALRWNSQENHFFKIAHLVYEIRQTVHKVGVIFVNAK
jgi:hypothetical protein